MSTGPLSRKQFDAIKEIMEERRFAVLHWGDEGLAYCNTNLGDEVGELVTRSARFLERKNPLSIGYLDEEVD